MRAAPARMVESFPFVVSLASYGRLVIVRSEARKAPLCFGEWTGVAHVEHVESEFETRPTNQREIFDPTGRNCWRGGRTRPW